MADSRVKQIRIKTGVVKRLSKEKLMYVKEVEKEKDKLVKMQAAGGDNYIIRKQEEIIRESMMMIPDTLKRFQTAHKELQEIVDNEADLVDNEEYQAALTVLKETEETSANE